MDRFVDLSLQQPRKAHGCTEYVDLWTARIEAQCQLRGRYCFASFPKLDQRGGAHVVRIGEVSIERDRAFCGQQN